MNMYMIYDTDRSSFLSFFLSLLLAGAVFIAGVVSIQDSVSVTGNDFSENKAGGPGGMLLY